MDEARRQRLGALRTELTDLRTEALAAEEVARELIGAVDPVHRDSAANIVHYRSVRSHDLRGLQPRLSAEGLSSLGRMESGVLGNLDAVIRIIDDALGEPEPSIGEAEFDGESGGLQLAENAAALLGGEPSDRSTRVMVTMPSTAATDSGFVQRCADAGMDLARINCAHDDPAAWRAIAANVRAANSRVRIAMDLAGPKLRTGPIAPGPQVLKVRPSRDPLGRVLISALFWLGEAPVRSDVQDAVPVVDTEWLAAREVGDALTMEDARGRFRELEVLEVATCGVLVATARTVYLTPGLEVTAGAGVTTVGEIPPTVQALRIFRGDTITVTADMSPTVPTDDGRHRIGCSLPEVFAAVETGHRVYFDDGKIEGVVTGVGADAVTVGVTRAALNGSKLRAEKGINLPDTVLPVPALTDDDIADLDAVVELADMVNLSFVRGPDDVASLQRELADRGASDLGVVLKIETVAGFSALPVTLLQLMRTRRIGVMIARGDLAVEAGFERLAEVQEEILWLCEAAHVPVIWATEVLDNLADRGLPTRAEVTDAAAGERAECVMLNKGPHIVEAIEALAEILARMKGHMDKKRPLLQRLGAWSSGF
ncbi:pyruvate kinase [Gordonia sp. NPDC003424]